MRARMVLNFLIIASTVSFLTGLAAAAESGTVTGYVRDSHTHEALPGANVLLVGTSMGASTDMNGKFLILNVPPGSYVIKASYVGYKSRESHVVVRGGVEERVNFELEAVGIQGKEVVVTAQASGQAQAINKELTSAQVVNAVSAAKIKELPDANAAESVGRLPGVFVLRSGGEGYKVVIRGLAPQYNEVTIDGIKMGSSDPNDRSTDLSMISSDMLEGIEVAKTVTPDMDADVIGGVVNFDMREAQVREPGVPEFNLLVQGGRNNLPDALNRYNNYKYVGSAEDRIMNDRLGIFAQASIERRNLTNDELGVSYTHFGNSITQYLINALYLSDIPRDRMRYNGALNLDYRLPDGTLKLVNFGSSQATRTQQRTESYEIGSNMLFYSFSNSHDVLNTVTNAVILDQNLPVFNVNLKLAHTYSDTRNPGSWDLNFSQTSGGLSQFARLQNVNPVDVPKAATRNLSSTYLNYFDNNTSFTKSRALMASIDLKTVVNLSSAISAEIKFGGKFRHDARYYAYDEYDTPQLLSSGSAMYVDNLINSFFSLPLNNTQISMTNFIDPGFKYGTFLDGDYSMVAPLNFGKLCQLSNLLQSNADSIAKTGNAGTYGHNNYLSTISNYSGTENHGALYAMATIKFGDYLTFIPGVRFQSLQTTYTGVRGITSPESYWAYNHYDTTVTQKHDYWLPDVTLRYKPLSWFDVRLSYTNTLAYPSFSAIVPRIDMSGTSIGWNNFALAPAHSRNYDAYFSFYNNTIGLFTVGAFLKHITDMIYSWTFFVKGQDALQYLPTNIANFNPNSTYQIWTTKNNPYNNQVYGIELDWQTHFWYLPDPLSGLVLGVNYTHTKSKAKYPYLYSVSTGRTITYIDTFFTDRLVDQPDNIVNLSLGFDYKAFSIRVAMVYQAGIFTSPSQWPQLRGYTAPYRRWDIAAKQKLPWFGVEVYADLNNINGAKDTYVIQGGPPSDIQDYGFTADVGIRWRL